MEKITTLLEIGPMELMDLWAKLVEAYHGVNGYGGHTAELYAYRFVAWSPIKPKNNEWKKAAGRLVELLYLFKSKFGPEIGVSIDGCTIADWEYYMQIDYIQFDHRVHVKIIRTE